MHDGGLPTVPDFWNLSRRWLVITLIHTCRYRLGVYAQAQTCNIFHHGGGLMAPLLLLTITYHYSSPFLTLQVPYRLHICRSISSSTMVYSLSSSSSNPYSSSSTMVYSLFSSFSSPYSSSSTMVYSLLSKYRRFFLKCLLVSILKDYFIYKKVHWGSIPH